MGVFYFQEGGDSTITNTSTGTITGTSFGISDTGSSGSITINNAGAILGGINLHNTNNILNLLTGSLTTGAISLGSNLGAMLVQGSANLSGVTSITGGGAQNNLTFDGTTQSFNSSVGITNWAQIVVKNGSNITLQESSVTLGSGGTYSGLPLGLNIAAASSLTATASGFTLNGDVNNSGSLSLQSGTSGNTWTTVGNYVGANGLLLLDSTLNGTESTTDRFILSGVHSATGSTGISVRNIGGLGNITTGNGIPVVEALAGASTSGTAFYLTSEVVSGPFEYTLYRGGYNGTAPNDWFLRSTATDSSGALVPNYRKEVSLYTALPSTELNYDRAILDTFHRRVGAEERVTHQFETAGSHPNSFWLRLINKGGTRDNNNYWDQGPTFNFQALALQGGGNIFELENTEGDKDFGGLYGVYGQNRSEVTHFTGASAGTIDFSAYTLGAYWTHITAVDWYFDAVLQGNMYDPKVSSPLYTLNKPSNFSYSASLESGIPFNWNDNFLVEPEVQLMYQNIPSYSGNYNLIYTKFDETSAFTSRLGARFLWTSNPLNNATVESLNSAKFTAWLTPSIWYQANGTSVTQFATSTDYVPLSSDLSGAWVSLDVGANYSASSKVDVYGVVSPELYLNDRGRAYNIALGARIHLD